MFRRILRDLTIIDFGLSAGPLVLAILAFVRAARATEPFDRWAWIAVAAVLLIVCAAYLAWVWRHRKHLADD